MTTISIIGSGNMATAIGTRAAKHGHTIEVMSRDTAKAQALADKIGNGAAAGTFGATPLGDIVIVAVPYTNAVSVVANYGDALVGKVIIDISNTFNADATGLVTPDGISGAQEIAKAVPASAHVVKAFNTVFGHVLAQGRPLDVLIAGDGPLRSVHGRRWHPGGGSPQVRDVLRQLICLAWASCLPALAGISSLAACPVLQPGAHRCGRPACDGKRDGRVVLAGAPLRFRAVEGPSGRAGRLPGRS